MFFFLQDEQDDTVSSHQKSNYQTDRTRHSSFGETWVCVAFYGFSICDISLFIYQLTPSETRFTMFSLKSTFLIVEDAVNNNQKDKTRHSSFGKSWMFSCSKPIS